MVINNELFELTLEEDSAKELNLDDFSREINMGNNSGLKVFHMNVCSLRRKYEQLEVIFKILHNVFDCIVFSETHTNYEINLNQFSLGDYKIYQTKNNKRKTDGVVVYVRSSLSHEVCEVELTDCNCLVLKINKNNKSYTLTNLYRSPQGKQDIFISEIKRFLEKFKDGNTCQIITGDINIDISQIRCAKAQKYLNLLTEFGFVCLINKCTRIRRKKGTSCLDHIFAQLKRDQKCTAYVVQTNITDHFSTALKIETNKIEIKEDEKYSEMVKINFDKILTDVSKERWEDVYDCEDPNLAASLMTRKIQKLIDDNKQISYKKNKIRLKPWITEGLINSIKTRDRLHILSKKQPLNKKLEDHYKKFRNLVTKLINKAKIQHFKKEIEKTKGDKRKVWQVVDDVIQYKDKDRSGPVKLIVDGSEIIVQKDTKKAANYFNKHYSEVGIKASNGENSQINNSDLIENLINSQKEADTSLYLKRVSREEIEKIINKLKNKSAPGHDNITTEIVKKLKTHISKPLCSVFNLCIKKGVFPDEYKRAVICPVYKNKGDRRSIESYRPVSLLTTFSKIFEKCIKARFVHYLENNEILSRTQFGFRQGKNTTDAVLEIVEGVYPALDKGEKVGGVFLDLSKAFDTVDHVRMAETLARVGVRGNCLKLFKSYLQSRTQQVKLRGDIKKSHNNENNENNHKENKLGKILSDEIQNAPFSTPQGTVLSPTLYNVYVSGLNHIDLHGSLVSFADDTVLWVKGQNWQEVFSKIQQDMQKIITWFQYHNLFINMNKTKMMPFTLNVKTLPTEREILIHEKPDCLPTCQCNMKIEVVKQTKYLGLELDCHLRWDKHVTALTKRLRRYIYPFLSLRKFMPLSLLKEIYFALAQSALEYGICVYGRADSTTLDKLRVVQNTLLKIIYFKERRFSTEILYKELGVLKFELLFKKNICSHVHTNKTQLIKYKETKYSFRERNPITVKCKTSKGQKSLEYLGIKYYESLPHSLKEIEKIDIFKLKLKEHLKQSPVNEEM